MKGTRGGGGPRSVSMRIVVAKGNSCKRSGWLVGSCPPPCRPHHVTPHTHPWCHPWWAGAGAGRVWGWGAQGQRAAAPQGCTCGAEHGCGSEGWVRRRVIQRGKADRPRPALYVRSLPPTPARTGQHGQLRCIRNHATRPMCGCVWGGVRVRCACWRISWMWMCLSMSPTLAVQHVSRGHHPLPRVRRRQQRARRTARLLAARLGLFRQRQIALRVDHATRSHPEKYGFYYLRSRQTSVGLLVKLHLNPWGYRFRRTPRP